MIFSSAFVPKSKVNRRSLLQASCGDVGITFVANTLTENYQ